MWWVLRGSNPRPTPCKGAALPAELSTLCVAVDNAEATGAVDRKRCENQKYRLIPRKNHKKNRTT